MVNEFLTHFMVFLIQSFKAMKTQPQALAYSDNFEQKPDNTDSYPDKTVGVSTLSWYVDHERRRIIRQIRMIEQNHLAAMAPASAALLAESNHRIANNLAVVAGYLILQANRTVREGGPFAACEVHSILAAASAKVSAAGNLHRMLTSCTEGEIDLGEYLEKVARCAVDTMTDREQVELTLDLETGCRVASDQALNLGLLVGELIVNAVKHAHPARSKGRIEVGCSLDARSIVAWVRDDGVGLPEGFDLAHDGGVGMRTLRLIAQQTGVEFDFVSTEIGLSVQMQIPNIEASRRPVEFAYTKL